MISIDRRAAIMGGVSLALVSAMPARAQDASAVGYKINIAGRQRMLSQRIAMAVCMARLGVEPEDNVGFVRASMAQFDLAQKALREGSGDFGLPKETHPSVLAALGRSDDAWADMAGTCSEITTRRTVSRQNLQDIAKLNLDVLSRANIVVKKMIAVYQTDDRSDLGSARAIDMAGRQRMLSQKMIKEAALIGLKFRKTDNRRFLEETLTTFDNSLFKLMYGDENDDFPAAPEPVLERLLDVEALWLDLYPLMDEIASSGRADSFELGELSASALRLLTMSNEAVERYEQSWQG
ncbi:MAG: type IV pili methyl-accepting chemotaxis transducer N-terminal domain-containing protein [Pseudomonadota bacterium]